MKLYFQPPPPVVKTVIDERPGSKQSNNKSSLSLSGSKQNTTKITRKFGPNALKNKNGGTMGTNDDTEQESGLELPQSLSKNRLIGILRAYGEYPSKYRYKSCKQINTKYIRF